MGLVVAARLSEAAAEEVGGEVVDPQRVVVERACPAHAAARATRAAAPVEDASAPNWRERTPRAAAGSLRAAIVEEVGIRKCCQKCIVLARFEDHRSAGPRQDRAAAQEACMIGSVWSRRGAGAGPHVGVGRFRGVLAQYIEAHHDGRVIRRKVHVRLERPQRDLL